MNASFLSLSHILPICFVCLVSSCFVFRMDHINIKANQAALHLPKKKEKKKNVAKTSIYFTHMLYCHAALNIKNLFLQFEKQINKGSKTMRVFLRLHVMFKLRLIWCQLVKSKAIQRVDVCIFFVQNYFIFCI